MDEKDSILIVDDDESTRRSLSLIFERKGYETETAGTGKEAMSKSLRRFFNLALVDVKLSDIAGVDLLGPLKEIHPDMVVIMVTAYASLETALRAINDGASAYITKPLNIDAVLATVRDVLEKQRLILDNQRLYQEAQRELAERKRIEEALRESEHKYRALFESTLDGLFVVDAETMTILLANEAAAKMYGFDSVEDAVGANPLDFVSPDDRERIVRIIFEDMFQKDLHQANEFRTMTKDGREIWISALGLRTEYQGRLAGLISLRDITKHKQMEDQFIMTDRMASIGQLASGIAHEINNPLTGVIGFSQLLLERDVPDDIREDLGIIHEEAKRASTVVKNLLTFARKHPPTKQLTNVNDIIEKVLELRAYEQRANDIQVNKQLAPDLPEIIADYFQLQQVFLNIILNAEYFMIKAHRRGTLTITTEKMGESVKISFIDDGPGIPKENLGHLFDPFFTTKEVGKGTGLGLSVCHGIITEHGGKIFAESELRQGATFVVELPIGATADIVAAK